jgi:hypothetical protein
MELYWILFRFLISFSAHNFIILRGFPLQCPFLNLNSPATYLSLSLNTKIDVLYIFIANSCPFSLHAWYTLASFPVEIHPLISFIIFLFNNFTKITLVLGSSTYSTVALSFLSFILYEPLYSWLNVPFIVLIALWWAYVFSFSRVTFFEDYSFDNYTYETS